MASTNIRELRKARGITQTELAERTGIKQSAISQWESGKTIPRSILLPKLATELDCTIEDLLHETA